MSYGKPKDSSDIGVKIIVTLFSIALLVLVGGTRLALSHGDVSCAFSNDPSLCAAVKEVTQ